MHLPNLFVIIYLFSDVNREYSREYFHRDYYWKEYSKRIVSKIFSKENSRDYSHRNTYFREFSYSCHPPKNVSTKYLYYSQIGKKVG